MGYNPLASSDEQFTSSSVVDELRLESIPHTRLKTAQEIGKLKIHTPAQAILNEIEEASRRMGDTATLSKTDKELLATALELSRNGASPILVSDDYALQNVADYLGLKYISLATHGIRYRFKWVLYCPACKCKYPSNVHPKTVCDICGTPLKRRVAKKYTKTK